MKEEPGVAAQNSPVSGAACAEQGQGRACTDTSRGREPEPLLPDPGAAAATALGRAGGSLWGVLPSPRVRRLFIRFTPSSHHIRD